MTSKIKQAYQRVLDLATFKSAYRIALDQEIKRFEKLENATEELKYSIYNYDDSTPVRKAESHLRIWRSIKDGADTDAIEKEAVLNTFRHWSDGDLNQQISAERGYECFEFLMVEQKVFDSIYSNNRQQIEDLDPSGAIMRSRTQDSSKDRPALSIAEAVAISAEVNEDQEMLKYAVDANVDFSEFEKTFTRDRSEPIRSMIAHGLSDSFEKLLQKKPSLFKAKHLRLMQTILDHHEVSPKLSRIQEMFELGRKHLNQNWNLEMQKDPDGFFQRAIRDRSFEAINYAATKNVYPEQSHFLQLEMYLESPGLSKMAKLSIDNVYQACADAALKNGILSNNPYQIREALLKGADFEYYNADSFQRSFFQTKVLSDLSLTEQMKGAEGLSTFDQIVRENNNQLRLPQLISRGDVGELKEVLNSGVDYSKAALRELIKIRETTRASVVMEELLKDRIDVGKEVSLGIGLEKPTPYESKMYRMIMSGELPTNADGSVDYGFVTQAETGFSAKAMDNAINTALEANVITKDQHTGWAQLIDGTEDFLEFKHEQDIKWSLQMEQDYKTNNSANISL